MKWITKELNFPYFTFLLNLLTIGLSGYVIFFGEDMKSENELLRLVGAPDAFHIYDGEYWGVFTNSFTHNNVIVLLFNVIGLWILGAFLERRSGWKSLLIAGCFASIITSSVQLAFSNDPGLGMSGVNYFLLGYLFVMSFKDERFHFPLKGLAITIGIFGPVFIFLGNKYFHTNIGLESIVTGVIFGVLSGLIAKKSLRLSFTSLLLLASIGSLIYAPWSAEWNFTKAVNHHRAGELREAELFYDKALKLDPSMTDARFNSLLIKIDRLSDEAYTLHLNRKYREAAKKYEEILQLDPQNQWAKDQLKALP